MREEAMMSRTRTLGTLGGVEVRAKPSALVAILGTWGLATAGAARLLRLPPGRAAAVGAGVTAIHWLSEVVHQYGHAAAARATGYPMRRMTFSWVLSQSGYPKDEPELPPETHIQRALGGPIANVAAGLLFAAVLAALPRRSPGWWVALAGVVENLVVFAAQVFVPLGFNDGSTILTNLRAIRRRASPSS
jgi:hypothetical protein